MATPIIKAEKQELIQPTIPEFEQFINVVLTKDNYEIVKEAVKKNPTKVNKIMQYVNQLPQDSLKEVFNRTVF